MTWEGILITLCFGCVMMQLWRMVVGVLGDG